MTHNNDNPAISFRDLCRRGAVDSVTNSLVEFIVMHDGFRIPVRIVRKDRLYGSLVMLNGAVDRQRSKNPVFQRSSWSNQIPQTQVYIYDPTLMDHSNLSLGWAVGRAGHWAVPAIRDVAVVITDALCGTGHQRTYFGSSAGGFVAIALASFDQRSRFIANNPQVDWLKWHERSVNTLFGCLSVKREEVNAAFSQIGVSRTNVLETAASSKVPLRGDVYLNMGSDYDRSVVFPELLEFSNQYPGLCADLRFCLYHDQEKGHNPMSQSETVKVLTNLAIG